MAAGEEEAPQRREEAGAAPKEAAGSPAARDEQRASSTPLPPRHNHNDGPAHAGGRPLVTDEKSAAAPPANPMDSGEGGHLFFSIACPDGTAVHLSSNDNHEKSKGKDDGSSGPPNLTFVVLGRGRHGVPPSVAHVSRRACVLRLVTTTASSEAGCDGTKAVHKDKMAVHPSLELAVLGSQPCRVTRANGEVVYMRSLADMLGNENEGMAPSVLSIMDGDLIEPYDRPLECTVEEAKSNGVYYPFKVSVIGERTEGCVDDGTITGEAFAEASRKLDEAAPKVDAPTRGGESREDGNEAMQQNDTGGQPAEAAHDGADEGKSQEDTQDFDLEAAKESATALATAELSGGRGGEGAHAAEKAANDQTGEQPTATGDVEMGEVAPVGDKPEAASEVAKSSAASQESRKAPAPEEAANGASSSDDSSVEEVFEIDDPREAIIEILQGVESPGTFAVGGSCDGRLAQPGLDVNGLGPIGLPLGPILARELIKRCEQAPFGRGAKTIVDKSVRNTSQLAPEHFQITNPSWGKELEALTKEVCEGLGVESHLKVEARLYKLLLYEEGSFFAPHRDSEKEPGMFGTLVVVLPSQFTGGELVVKHHGDIETFEQGPQSSNFKSQYAAFYAGTKHELRKVTSGYRMCLVYNLVKVGAGPRPIAIDNRSDVKKLIAASLGWAMQWDAKKLVLMTAHLYTPAGIKHGKGSAKYKGADAVVVELLEQAIEKGADLDFGHGTVSFSESGYGEGDGYGYGYHRRRYWDDYSDDDDENYTWAETTDSTLSLRLAEYGSVSIDQEEELIPGDFFDNKDPIDETFEPTGNEGVNAERQYADAEAIVVWPRSQRWKVVTDNNVSRMVNYLVKACEEGTKDSEPLEECKEKANQILGRGLGANDVPKMMKCIVKVGDEELATKLLTSYLAANPKTTPDAVLGELQAFIDRFGIDAIKPAILSSINATRFDADPTALANFLLKFNATLGQKEDNSSLTHGLVDAFVNAMCPAAEADRRVPSRNVDSFPLHGIIGVLRSHSNSGTLIKRVVKAYIWLSCQQTQQSSSYSYHRYSSRTTPKGPKLLIGVASSIVSLCDEDGWKEHEGMLVEAAEKLCQYGRTDDALQLVEKISATTASSGATSERSAVCRRMATVACEKILARSHQSASLDVCKKLVQSIGRYCPSFAPRFVEFAKKVDVGSVLYPLVIDGVLWAGAPACMRASLATLTIHCASDKAMTVDKIKALVRAISSCCPEIAPQFTESAKKLDVDSVLYPLVTNNALRSGLHANMKESLGLLTRHCARALSAGISDEQLGTVKVWSIPHASSSESYRDFLRSPCKQTLDWQVRKSDHNRLQRDLSTLIRSGEVRAISHQPRGRGPWHFKIEKLNHRMVATTTLENATCSCSRYYRHSSQQQTPSGCVLKQCQAKTTKYRDAKRKLAIVKALLTPEERSQLDSRSGSSAASFTSGTGAVTIIVTKPTKDTRLGLGMPVGSCPIRITSINPTGLFAHSQLRVGMVLHTINGKTYSSHDEGLAHLKDARGQLTVVASYPSFMPSPRFQGAIPGYVYMHSTQGTGYYLDNSAASHTAATNNSQPAAKRQKTSDVIELLDDDDDVQFEGVMSMEESIAKKRKEAEEKGEIVEIL